jgi:hypothetical protein
MYDNTGIGEWMKENSMRPGDMILIALFVIITISAIEMIALGLGEEE